MDTKASRTLNIQLKQAFFRNMTEEFICKAAKNLKEVSELIESGFDYVTEMDGCRLFRKRKTSLLEIETENDQKRVANH